MSCLRWAQQLLFHITLVFWGDYCILFFALDQNIVRKVVIVCCTTCTISSIDAHHRFLTKNRIPLINNFPYLSDLAPCNFYLFIILHLAIKFMHYADIPAIWKDGTDISRTMLANDLNSSFQNVLFMQVSISNRSVAILSIIKIILAKKNHFLFLFRENAVYFERDFVWNSESPIDSTLVSK